MARLLPFVLACILAAGCDAGSADPDWATPDGTASAIVDGRAYDFRVFAQPNSYNSDEVVLRAYADSLLRTLMLTFDPKQAANVNLDMTGFWELGLCLPTSRYVVDDPSDVSIRVEDYNRSSRRLRGTFAVRMTDENEPGNEVVFAEGSFDVRLRREPFEYCIEG